ncbi:hypothetical protein BJ170DRAFT_685746 [Xylariales sp. AK1849]|nr:hypothetical protein BJ170DRAFT_685746 [Xylariales sp. AK1849]
MNEFRELSRDLLRSAEHVVQPAPDFKYRVFATLKYTAQDGSVSAGSQLRSDELLDFIAKPVEEQHHFATRMQTGAGTQASLRLIEIPTDPNSALVIGTDILSSLLESLLDVDYGALWLIIHKYDGFHSFPGTDRETFFFGWPFYGLMWTFNHKTLTTHVLLINRNERARSARAVHELTDIVTRHGSYIASPGFLGYALSLAICQRFDSYDGEIDWRRVRLIEKSTGYSYTGRPKRADINIDDLTQWLQQTGEVRITTSLRKRILRNIVSILDHVASDMGSARADCIRSESQVLVEESTRHLLKAVPPMRSRIHAYDEFLDYMTVRVERLSTVLFALLTHKDAQTSIEQAHASRELAEAAKRDSSAMKTIAVMTMAFLPATFFAALFAVPSLDWQSDTVIQKNHWVYWAFTVDDKKA